VPNVLNLFDVAAEAGGVAKIVIKPGREMLLKSPTANCATGRAPHKPH
jgi:hypothetical protein